MMRNIGAVALSAALFAGPALAGDCANYRPARDQVYTVLSGPIMPELQKKGVQSKERLGMAMQALGVQYRDAIAAGDKFAPLNMVGLHVLTLPFTGDSVDPATKADACAMVGAEPDSKIMLLPLGCAAMLLDGAGKDDAAARGQARAALDAAKARLPNDPNGEGATKLFEATEPALRACAAE